MCQWLNSCPWQFRFRCYFHVSVSGHDRVRCGVHVHGWVRSCPWQCLFPSLFRCQCQCPSLCPCPCPVSMTVSVSVSVSMSGSCPSVSNRVLSVSVFLLMSVRDCVDQCLCSCMFMSVSEFMFVTKFVFVTISVTLSVSVVVPVTSSVRVCVHGRDHIFERVTVRVAACRFSVIVSMHDHVSVRVNVRFRVRDHAC